MADATQGDTDVQSLGLLASALIALIAGLLIHSFIIGVNVSDWWKGRSVTAFDHIITSLGISRICAQFVDTLHLVITISFLKNRDFHITQVTMEIVYDFLSYANVWLTSLLSIVLCLKISNFHSRLFLYLRGMITSSVHYLIVASVALAAFSCFHPLLMVITKVIKHGTYNTTMDNLFSNCRNYIYLYNYATGPLFPLLFYYISSVLLFSSLYHHTTKMKMSSNLSISLETYYSAMRFISVTFIYNTLYCIVTFVGVFHYYFYCVELDWLYVVLEFLPVLHSSYLIYRTAKLRSQVSKVLQNMIDFLFQSKDIEIRENIEIIAQLDTSIGLAINV